MKELIKNRLKAFPILYNFLRKTYGYIRALRKARVNINKLLIGYRIEQALRKKSTAFFVQVGSNDGFHGDPLYSLIKAHENWAGIFIEPVKYAFEKLKLNYGDSPKYIFENLAVGTKNEIRK